MRTQILCLVSLILIGCSKPDTLPVPIDSTTIQEEPASEGEIGGVRTTEVVAAAGQEAQLPGNPKHAIDQEAERCMEAEGYSGQGVAICLDQSLQDWDEELNRQYRLLISRSEGAEPAVREAQLAWIAHRDREFIAIDELFGQERGSSWVSQIMELRLNVVRDRALQFAALNGVWT